LAAILVGLDGDLVGADGLGVAGDLLLSMPTNGRRMHSGVASATTAMLASVCDATWRGSRR